MGNGPVAGYLGALYINQKNALNGASTTVADPADGHLDFTASASFSVECWINCGSVGDDTIVKKGGGTLNAGYRLDVTGNKAQFTISNGASDLDATATSSDIGNDSLWHHIVGVRNAGTNTIIYVDGTDCGSASDITGDTLATASDFTMDGQYKYAHTRVFDTALSASQVSDMYAGDLPGAVADNVVGSWGFHEGSGTNLYDSSTYHSDGTIAGGAWCTTTYDTATAENVGAGDGATKAFSTDYENVSYDNLTVTVGGDAKYIGTDFTLTPKGTLTFHTAPAAGAILVTYRYYRMTLEAGGFHAWGIDWTGDVHDTTDFTSAGPKSFTGGLTSWTASAERHWCSPQFMSAFSAGAEYQIKFFFDEANSKYFNGWARVTGIGTTNATDGIVEESLSFQGTQVLSQE